MKNKEIQMMQKISALRILNKYGIVEALRIMPKLKNFILKYKDVETREARKEVIDKYYGRLNSEQNDERSIATEVK